MRWRVGVSLLLVTASVGVGCRKAAAPNVDRNQPPETWITAAPLDTVGGRGIPAPLGTIPFRFHLYWAGSDPDGEVRGFFFAVTETTAIPAPGEGIPGVPGPKPQDYKFTARTDSTFVFNVIEGRPDRQHGFFIYAVDNEGKVDASPARFVFNALDKCPPIPVITRAEARGTIYTIGPGGTVSPVEYRRGPSWQPGMAGDPRNLDDVDDPRTLPRDTIPSGASVYFEWTSLIQCFGSYVAKYRYKLTEVDFQDFPPESTSKFYPAGSVPPGNSIFRLRAVDQANGSNDSTRRFVVNFSPDTWFAGPDFNCIQQPGSGWQQAAPRGSASYWYYPVPNQFGGPRNLPAAEIPCTYYGPSNNAGDPRNWVNVLYADRPERRTFLEWWEDTLYARAEGDTVHLNSIVIFASGGLDFDSPHLPLVSANPPPGVVPDGPNTRRGPANGSPIGFSGLVIVAQDPNRKGFRRPAENLTYPDFRIGTPYYNAVPVLQEVARSSGYAYARLRAADGDGFKDNRVRNPVDLADVVDRGGGTAYERNILRRKVLTFYVNKNARLLEENPGFAPRINQTFTSNPLNLNLLTENVDPANIGEITSPGRKGVNNVRRTSVTLCGDSSGVPVCRPDIRPIGARLNQPTTIVSVPSSWSRGTVNVVIEVCDCQFCEDRVGEGRCTTRTIPINWQPPGPSGPGLAPASGGNSP